MAGNLLGAIANPAMADIEGALDYREKKLAEDEERRKQIRINQLAGQALSTGLVEGSIMHKLALEDPKSYFAVSKSMGVDPSDGSGVNQLTVDVNTINRLADGGDVPGAINYMRSELDRRKQLGLKADYLEKGLEVVQQDPAKFFNAVDLMDRSLNPSKEAEGFTLGEGQKRFDSQGRQIASVAKAAGSGDEKLFRGEVVNTANGAFVYSGKGNTLEPLLDPQGNQVKSSVYDPKAIAENTRAKTDAEVSTKQSLDLAKTFYEKIAPINNAIANFDDAARLIDSGAGTGKIESLLPSFRQSSIELDNVRRNLGLNVIQNTTFGALSEGELRLALDTGLPQGLDGPQLKDWIMRKKDAQVKMRDYLENAINYLGEGHTIADLSRKQRNQRQGGSGNGGMTPGITENTTDSSIDELVNKYAD
jgi:hypothetical protein